MKLFAEIFFSQHCSTRFPIPSHNTTHFMNKNVQTQITPTKLVKRRNESQLAMYPAANT